jgi:hypothetical protein
MQPVSCYCLRLAVQKHNGISSCPSLPGLNIPAAVCGLLATARNSLFVGAGLLPPPSTHILATSLQAVDYLGLDAARQLLLFAASSPEALRDIKLPLAAVSTVGSLDVHTDLVDQHLYVLSR